MMGTYDTPRGNPLHDPAADYCPSDEECELALLREQKAQMLEALKIIAAKADELDAEISAHAANRIVRDKLSHKLQGIILPAKHALAAAETEADKP